MNTITTTEEFESFVQHVSETAETAVVRGRESNDVWLVFEDEHGDVWAYGIPDDSGRKPFRALEDLWAKRRRSLEVIYAAPGWPSEAVR